MVDMLSFRFDERQYDAPRRDSTDSFDDSFDGRFDGPFDGEIDDGVVLRFDRR
jgi:hypothetical protein